MPTFDSNGNPTQINQNNGLPNGQQNGNSQQQQSQNSLENFGADFGMPLDDDSVDNSLFEGFGDNVDDDFEIEDDWLNPKKLNADGTPIEDDENLDPDADPEDPDGSKKMMTEIQNHLKAIKIADQAIPENFDPTDRAQLTKLLNHTAQMGAQSAMAIMSIPMKKYVESVAKELRGEISTSVKRGGFQSKVEEAFEPFKIQLAGDKNKPSLAYAKQTFAQALKNLKDPRKAAQATQRLIKQLGINVNLAQRQGSTNSSQNNMEEPRVRTGANALEDLFGKPSAR